jgi:SynChlorMet cassette protein ScmC
MKKNFLLNFAKRNWCFSLLEKELIPLLNRFALTIGLEDSFLENCEESLLNNLSRVFISTQLNENKFRELIREANPIEEKNSFGPIQKICQSHLFQLWSYQDKNLVNYYGIKLCDESNLNEGNKESFDVGRMRFISIPIFIELQKTGGFSFHSAFIKRYGKGILLSAPSKTGKTTCCCRIPSSWTVLSDDTTVIVRDGKQYKVHPFPTWSKFLPAELRTKRSFEYQQKRWDIKQNASLDLILFLEQAESDEIVPLNQIESSARIYRSSIQANYLMLVNKDDDGKIERLIDNKKEISLKQELFQSSCDLAKSVKTFVLRASLDGHFWEQIEKVL